MSLYPKISAIDVNPHLTDSISLREEGPCYNCLVYRWGTHWGRQSGNPNFTLEHWSIQGFKPR